MALKLARTLLRVVWEGLKFLTTFTGDLGTQVLILLGLSIILPPIIDFIDLYGRKAFVWLLDIFR